MAAPFRNTLLCLVFLCQGLLGSNNVWLAPFNNMDGRILLGEHIGFVEATKETTLGALLHILQASSALQGTPLQEIKEGSEWKVPISFKGKSHEATLAVTEVFKGETRYGIQIRLSIDKHQPIRFDLVAQSCDGGSKACTRISTRKPTKGDVAGAAVEHLVFKPLQGTLGKVASGDFFGAFANAVSSQFTAPQGFLADILSGIKDLNDARKMGADFSIKFVEFWRAYATFLHENPTFSIDEFLKLASSGERPSLNAIFRSPYGHSLKALNALIQTVVKYRKYLKGYGLVIDDTSNINLKKLGSQLHFVFDDIPVFVTVLGSYPQVRLGLSMVEGQPLAEVILREKDAVVEYTALDETWTSSRSHTEIDIQVVPASDIASTLENPEQLFAALLKWQTLSQKMDAVPSTNAYMDLFFELWADLSSRIANTTGSYQSTCVGFLVTLIHDWTAISGNLSAPTGNQPARIEDKSGSRTD